MPTQELTPSEISSMSEVVAKYMGKNIHEEDGMLWVTENGCDVDFHNWAEYHTSWDWIHEVWDKVSEEEVDGMNEYWYQIELAICGNDIQEAFWALHRAIDFINILKK